MCGNPRFCSLKMGPGDGAEITVSGGHGKTNSQELIDSKILCYVMYSIVMNCVCLAYELNM